ncbi:MAG: peptidylprolyl isomerase [Deltaproteobacteria bacterium]|nr:peptidylprolyl isomerase [Deltaproteobacteria bacterium]
MADAIKSGDTISVNYTGKFENGEVFDTSENRDPLKFTVGEGQLIKGFDNAVIGLQAGEKTSATIAPADGYGERRDDMVIDMPKENVPADVELEIGMRLQLQNQDGSPVPVVVKEILDEVVKMDANHPLAGETLVFDIEVVETGLEPDPPQSDCGSSCSSCGGSCG